MKSLSNIIKSNYIYINREEKKVIDSDTKAKIVYPEIFCNHQQGQSNCEGFIAGLQAVPIEEFQIQEADPQQTIQEAETSAKEMIESAGKEAESIIENAKKEAEVYSYKIKEHAKQQGYIEGVGKGNIEIEQKLEELRKRELALEEEYQEKMKQLEPAFVELTAALLEKLTGVIMKERKDVIFHLMERSLRKLAKNKAVIIRVSNYDAEYVTEKKDAIEELLAYPCEISILKDETFIEGQCMIETDDNMIDCSLGTQLTGLIEELKTLV